MLSLVGEQKYFCSPTNFINDMNDLFRKFANATSNIAGSPWAFLVALSAVIIWLVTGPLFGFSDTWQLVINTGTTIVTFLMVFLIQNTQNRDSKSLQLKLDELIRATGDAEDEMIDSEDFSDDDLKELKRNFKRLQRCDHGRAKELTDQLQKNLSKSSQKSQEKSNESS